MESIYISYEFGPNSWGEGVGVQCEGESGVEEWRSGGGPEVAAFVSGRIQGRKCAQLVRFVSIVVLYMCHSWGIVGSGVSHHSDAHRWQDGSKQRQRHLFSSVIINVKSNIGIVQELSSDGWLIPNVMISCLHVHPLRLGGISVPDPLELFRPRTILSL